MTHLDELGPFFGVARHAASDHAITPWTPMSDLLADPGILTDRVARVRGALAAGGPVEERVAASVTHLGLVARIIAPAIAVEALGDPPISLRPDDIWWQDELGGPYPLSVTAAEPGTDSGDSVVEALTHLVGDTFGVSARTLWGNVASAANSAAQLIAAARPDLQEAARDAADRLLADGRVEGGALRSGPTFRRRSCCLIYQVSGDRRSVCGDCVLT
ncbi:(2Fe-2S)-binding protein [Gordonia sp. VNQ95]|uniref:(2Fe-2S)-binding protein n=1 Tax=Gordonia sp. VNQ95 TaxID=3156619 RepID=UPI0032B3CA6E